MSLNDVNKLGTIAYEEVVHVERAFDTEGYTFNDRVDFMFIINFFKTLAILPHLTLPNA